MKENDEKTYTQTQQQKEPTEGSTIYVREMEESWPEGWYDIEQSSIYGNDDVGDGEGQVCVKLLLPRLADHEGKHACNYEHITEQKGDVALS